MGGISLRSRACVKKQKENFFFCGETFGKKKTRRFVLGHLLFANLERNERYICVRSARRKEQGVCDSGMRYKSRTV